MRKPAFKLLPKEALSAFVDLGGGNSLDPVVMVAAIIISSRSVRALLSSVSIHFCAIECILLCMGAYKILVFERRMAVGEAEDFFSSIMGHAEKWPHLIVLQHWENDKHMES